MRRYSIILLLITCLGIGCEDVNFRSSVPNVPVSYNLYITREYPHFIIDNGFQTMTITEHRFEVDGLYAICPLCDEQFDLGYGYAVPTKGVTKEPLRKYQALTQQTTTGLTLRITN